MNEIGEQEKNIEELKKGVSDKMGAMMVAQTRFVYLFLLFIYLQY